MRPRARGITDQPPHLRGELIAPLLVAKVAPNTDRMRDGHLPFLERLVFATVHADPPPIGAEPDIGFFFRCRLETEQARDVTER